MPGPAGWRISSSSPPIPSSRRSSTRCGAREWSGEPAQPLVPALARGGRAGDPDVLPQAEAEEGRRLEHLAVVEIDPGHPRERAVPEAADQPAAHPPAP